MSPVRFWEEPPLIILVIRMETFLTVIHILAAVFMILVILVQGGNQGGVGAAFGGGNSQGVFGASGATTFLAKLTYFVAGIFMLTSIGLSWAQKQSGETGLIDRLKEKTETSAPAETQSTPAGSDQDANSTESAPSEGAPAADDLNADDVNVDDTEPTTTEQQPQ